MVYMSMCFSSPLSRPRVVYESSSQVNPSPDHHNAIVIPINVGHRMNTTLNFALSRSIFWFALYACGPGPFPSGSGSSCVVFWAGSVDTVEEGDVVDVIDELVMVRFAILKPVV
jgi:hypothetical protein